MVKQSRPVQILQFAKRVDNVETVEVSREELRISLKGVRREKNRQDYLFMKLEGQFLERDNVRRKLKKLRMIIKDLERAILMSYDR